ncbi:MAG TPA: peptidoglycan-binding domain-containing protein [Solirubrobacteraceae bacterium]|nr:peptidoglycan-binding domain-containing protein [Solirubrobacteraceae bacterium]
MLEVRGARGCRRFGRRRLRRLHLIILIASAVLALPAAAAARPNPLAGRAMWIWEMPAVDGGNVSQIIATAHQYGIGTLMIKSSDGTNLWSQFNGPLVAQLHAAGLRVCAWQYVYGTHPVTEAYMGAYAVRDGADCLIIDAESEYEGKYISAQTYIRRLRALVGYGYPLALAGFPYVDYHPAFPYSVFLGPGGAQYNAPQMYWRDIGVTTDTVFAHTYSFNLVYQRPIFPLGQVFSNPPAHQIVRFRQLSRAYGASGISWWDWQEATSSDWTAVSRPAGGLGGYVPYKVMANVGQGAQGDMVVWAQEHLVSAGYPISVSGSFGYHTLVDVEAFQSAHGLTADGVIGQDTWSALLRYRVARVNWIAGGGQHAVVASAASHAVRGDRRPAAGTSGGPVIVAPVPRSASRPAKRNEIAGAGGAGRPPIATLRK